MSEETTDIQPHDDHDEPGGSNRPTPLTLVIASVFLTAPALIPFYYAMQQDDATLKWVFIGTGFSLVIFNALALVLIYRWIQRINQP